MSVMNHLEKLIDTCFACFPRRRPQTSAAPAICLIAHRGAHHRSLRLQENTIAAFERALDLGCYGIELDIHASADGVLVVNHDSSLKRLWGHDVEISTYNFHELRELAPELPTLAEVVAKYGKRMHLFIELKAPFEATAALAEILQTLTPCVDYHLLSLDETLLPQLTEFPKKSLLLVPVHNNVNQFCELSLQQQYGGVLGHYLLINKRQIERLRKANQLVGVGFIDSRFSLYRELNRDISLLFTNNATTVTTYIQKLAKKPSD